MKKGRKWKLLAGAMALVMTAGSLTACGSNEGQQAADSQPQSVAGTESAAAESAGAQGERSFQNNLSPCGTGGIDNRHA